MHFPAHVAVVGGGRWSRVFVDVLSQILPAQSKISVHSPRGSQAVGAWAEARGLRARLEISETLPEFAQPRDSAAIVVNAARDHAMTAETLLRWGVATLVEKPIATTLVDASRLATVARGTGARLAAAQVLLFAPYLDRFRTRVEQLGPLDQIAVEWTDPAHESRYGERKSYDAAVPVFADVMPHVAGILAVVSGCLPEAPELANVSRGGASVTMRARAGSTACTASMQRNSDQRRRLVRAVGRTGDATLDFSQEPGTITVLGRSESSDPNWESAPRPMTSLANAFLGWAAGGESDVRLGLEIPLRACALSDELQRAYNSAIRAWRHTRVGKGSSGDADLAYALAEERATTS